MPMSLIIPITNVVHYYRTVALRAKIYSSIGHVVTVGELCLDLVSCLDGEVRVLISTDGYGCVQHVSARKQGIPQCQRL